MSPDEIQNVTALPHHNIAENCNAELMEETESNHHNPDQNCIFDPGGINKNGNKLGFSGMNYNSGRL